MRYLRLMLGKMKRVKPNLPTTHVATRTCLKICRFKISLNNRRLIEMINRENLTTVV